MTVDAPPLDDDRADASSVDEASSHTLGESDRRFWRRHPGDVVRLVVRSVVLAVLLALTAAFPHGVGRVSINLVDLFAELPDAVPLRARRVRPDPDRRDPARDPGVAYLRRSALEAAMVLGSAIAGGVLMALLTDWLVRAAPPGAISGLPSSSFLSTDFPSPAYLAALVAGCGDRLTADARQWRRVAWGGVLAAAMVRFLSATQAPVSVLVTIALGAVVGSAVLVAFGSPRRRPGAMSLRTDLAARWARGRRSARRIGERRPAFVPRHLGRATDRSRVHRS